MKMLRMLGLAMVFFGAMTVSSCKKDPCKNVTCQNGGICQDGNCKCNPPWEGPRCEVKKDPCENVTCQNGGTCQDGNCKCNLPWEGSRCEVDARDKFVGAWQGTENCGTPSNYTTTINRSQASPTRITIYEPDLQITYYAELNSSTGFTIPQQTYTIQGLAIGIPAMER